MEAYDDLICSTGIDRLLARPGYAKVRLPDPGAGRRSKDE
jgi:hypothetical protein